MMDEDSHSTDLSVSGEEGLLTTTATCGKPYLQPSPERYRFQVGSKA